MRKQTKLVAVLSAAALLAMGASMTSFAAGWEKDADGTWHYYDKDDEMVTDEWKKDGGKWFYLDEDGAMLINDWVDDEYFVGEDGAMLVNEWKKTMPDGDQDDPDEDGEYWYYFGSKGKKITDDDKKINGKTYYFDEDGKMYSGWQEFGGEAYYLGDEDDGARKESQWLWLEKSGALDPDDADDEIMGVPARGCTDDDDCDDEGWYWFGSSGKANHDVKKKKINGRYYMFNNHGQMLYEWIDNDTSVKIGSNAQLDDSTKKASAPNADIANMFYYNSVEEGWRANGWYQIDGAKDVGTDGDTDWYYIDDGEVQYADDPANDYATDDEDGAVYVQRIKCEGKYFAFNEKGQMQDGLQYIGKDKGFYYFDENGYQKTGRVANVECDDDDYNFYFNTKNGKNGIGYKGEKDGYLYFEGKRLEADDDYRLFYYDGDIYLTNTKGKIQKAKSEKKYDVENRNIAEEDVLVKTDSQGRVEYVTTSKGKKDKAALISAMETELAGNGVNAMEDMTVSVPFISLYDDDVYTYDINSDGTIAKTVGWVGVNK